MQNDLTFFLFQRMLLHIHLELELHHICLHWEVRIHNFMDLACQSKVGGEGSAAAPANVPGGELLLLIARLLWTTSNA